MPRVIRLALLSLSLGTAAIGTSVLGQNSASTPLEQKTSRTLEATRKNPLALHALIERMPKGADLHMHLSGAIYAETFLRDAAADLLCVNLSKMKFEKNVGTSKGLPAQAVCAEGSVPAADAFKNQELYKSLIDTFSMRSFVPVSGRSGHDQFFDTFGRFGGVEKNHLGEWLDEVATRASAQNEQYLEIMETPSFSAAAKLGYQAGWPARPASARVTAEDDVTGTSPAELSKLRDQLLAAGLRDEVATDRREYADALADRNQIEHCGQPDAKAGCSVTIRFLYQILRSNSPQQVFAQTLLGFEVASADSNVVGLNFVQPEDDYMAMSEYRRQMRILDYLHSVYPKVHISLHAGELAPGLVPPEGLRFHIREAIDLGHAERIGHGVDVMYEDDPQALLKEMADRHIMAEINLTSNDGILGIEAPFHPLPDYLAAHVPVALSTDDEGVSRIDMTHEYTRAAMEYGLSYTELKTMVRTGLEHSFLAGDSLWQQNDRFTAVVAACAGQPIGADEPKGKCGEFLKNSDKASQQWQLEHRFHIFESTVQ
ncbi:adenosine deaminase family protein [Granulicella aggregans]|jgi:adenosine deaminase|uniref:adenosine deaminase family protein n=1 Tax=Granulicella aggregans TaxID=474949 RepID=UPI0021E0C7E7|nr:adenosine deaminase [Granulicella aggregans]